MGETTGLEVLNGGTSQGADGNLNVITQDGSQAWETWTTAQSGTLIENLYTQVDPSSAVDAASDLTVTVTDPAAPLIVQSISISVAGS